MAIKLMEKDIIETKKNHPCGSYSFEIVRAGMDFRIRCTKCEKEIWIARNKLEKRIKKITRNGENVDFR